MYIHMGLNVTDLEKSIEFYTKLFGQEPVSIKTDYAKFLLENPQTNFTLNARNKVHGNQVGHFGFQVASEQKLTEQKNRLEGLGFFAREETNTTCCYARQDKFWITDPDGNEWEYFFTMEYIDDESQGACCSPVSEKHILNV